MRFRNFLLVALVMAMASTAVAAESWTASGVNVSTLFFNNDNTVSKYSLYAFSQEGTSVAELSELFAKGSFNDFKNVAIANNLKSSGATETEIWMNGLFADGNSREVLFEDGISLNLYAVAVYDGTHFKVMNECFRILHSNPNYSGGTWSSFAVPEPTSGVLLLLGLASMLALRVRPHMRPENIDKDSHF